MTVEAATALGWLIIRGAFRAQLGLLGFAMEVGEAPWICRLQAPMGSRKE
ncbi:MAG TPA: hypothetical protein VFQ79_23490 [Bryobacteraceae bacterium]|nr:hypothetical protein [Bryobacteraceae bacterium]